MGIPARLLGWLRVGLSEIGLGLPTGLLSTNRLLGLRRRLLSPTHGLDRVGLGKNLGKRLRLSWLRLRRLRMGVVALLLSSRIAACGTVPRAVARGLDNRSQAPKMD